MRRVAEAVPRSGLLWLYSRKFAGRDAEMVTLSSCRLPRANTMLWSSGRGQMDWLRRLRWRRRADPSWCSKRKTPSAAGRALLHRRCRDLRTTYRSAVHPLAFSSPFFRTLPLAQYGLQFIQPDVPIAHPLDGGTAVIVERSVELTAARLGRDGENYVRMFGPLGARLAEASVNLAWSAAISGASVCGSAIWFASDAICVGACEGEISRRRGARAFRGNGGALDSAA